MNSTEIAIKLYAVFIIPFLIITAINSYHEAENVRTVVSKWETAYADSSPSLKIGYVPSSERECYDALFVLKSKGYAIKANGVELPSVVKIVTVCDDGRALQLEIQKNK